MQANFVLSSPSINCDDIHIHGMSQLQDQISLKHDAGSKEKLLVFFITGNPGLIEYYRSFLTLCYDSLRSNHKDLSISVYGTSLAGFEVSSPNTDGHKKGPWDLEQQIQHIDQTLTSQSTSEHNGAPPPRVILIGHSVGSYILLEVLRRQKARSTTSSGKQGARIISGICLFPTVTHIAQSPSGKKFSVCEKTLALVIVEKGNPLTTGAHFLPFCSSSSQSRISPSWPV